MKGMYCHVKVAIGEQEGGAVVHSAPLTHAIRINRLGAGERDMLIIFCDDQWQVLCVKKGALFAFEDIKEIDVPDDILRCAQGVVSEDYLLDSRHAEILNALSIECAAEQHKLY